MSFRTSSIVLSRHIAMLAAIVAAACVGTASAAPPSDAELQSKVDAIAAEHLAKIGAVGLSIGVARGGKVVVAKGYGLADAEFNVPADADTMFRIGSVTKQFTAAAIMRFVEQGKISLDDDFNKYLPDYPAQGNTVTIRHLLNHTSGIMSYTDVGEEWQKVHPLELTHDELLALVKDKPFDFKPGEKWAYNNTAYYMLGMIIEKVSGKSYGDYMRDEMFAPLNLERTRYDSNGELIRNRAQGYTLRDGVLGNDDPLGMSQPGAAGALLSTGGELVEWSMALVSGKVVKPESFALMTTSTILPDGEDTNYGFGLSIDDFEGHKRIQHGGGIHGFNSMLLWLPDDDNLHVAVISNGEPVSSGRIATAITRVALGLQRSEARDVAITPHVMKRIAGEFRLEEASMDAKIWDEGGKAMLQASGEGQGAFALIWQGPDVAGGNEFRAGFDPDMRIIFAEDGSSFELHQGGGRITAKRKS